MFLIEIARIPISGIELNQTWRFRVKLQDWDPTFRIRNLLQKSLQWMINRTIAKKGVPLTILRIPSTFWLVGRAPLQWLIDRWIDRVFFQMLILYFDIQSKIWVIHSILYIFYFCVRMYHYIITIAKSVINALVCFSLSQFVIDPSGPQEHCTICSRHLNTSPPYPGDSSVIALGNNLLLTGY